MRIDIVDKFYITDPTSAAPIVIGVRLGVQTQKNGVGTVRGEIIVQGKEYQDFVSGGLTEQEIAEKKLREILELDRATVDAFRVEKYERALAEKDKQLAALNEAVQGLQLAQMENALKLIESRAN